MFINLTIFIDILNMIYIVDLVKIFNYKNIIHILNFWNNFVIQLKKFIIFYNNINKHIQYLFY